MQAEKEYRIKDAAKILGVCHKTVLNYIHAGHIHAYQKVKTNDGRGCPMYIKESELQRFIAKGEDHGNA